MDTSENIKTGMSEEALQRETIKTEPVTGNERVKSNETGHMNTDIIFQHPLPIKTEPELQIIYIQLTKDRLPRLKKELFNPVKPEPSHGMGTESSQGSVRQSLDVKTENPDGTIGQSLEVKTHNSDSEDSTMQIKIEPGSVRSFDIKFEHVQENVNDDEDKVRPEVLKCEDEIKTEMGYDSAKPIKTEPGSSLGLKLEGHDETYLQSADNIVKREDEMQTDYVVKQEPADADDDVPFVASRSWIDDENIDAAAAKLEMRSPYLTESNGDIFVEFMEINQEIEHKFGNSPAPGHFGLTSTNLGNSASSLGCSESTETSPGDTAFSPGCSKSTGTSPGDTALLSNETYEKTFQCKNCDKVFAAKCNLRKHKRIHTGEKPFKCQHCETGFFQKSHLLRHKRIHTERDDTTMEGLNNAFTDEEVGIIQENLAYHETMIGFISKLCNKTPTLLSHPKEPALNRTLRKVFFETQKKSQVLTGTDLHNYLVENLCRPNTSDNSHDSIDSIEQVGLGTFCQLENMIPNLQSGYAILRKCNSNLLSNSIDYGKWLDKAFELHALAKLSGTVTATWKDWLKTEVGISDAYARRLREISKLLQNHSKFRNLGIPFNDVYRMRKQIKSMLLLHPNHSTYWKV